METRKEVIKQMGDEMKEDIFLEVNRRIHRNLRKRFWLKASAIAASIALYWESLIISHIMKAIRTKTAKWSRWQTRWA